MQTWIPTSFQLMPWGWLGWIIWGCLAVAVWWGVLRMIQWNTLVTPLDAKSPFLFPIQLRGAQLSLGMLILAVLVILLTWRPEVFKVLNQPAGAGHNLFFLIDVSNSMNIEDLPPSRLETVKKNIEVFVRQSGPTHAYGLAVFANSFYFVAPLTTDVETFLFLLNRVQPGMLQGHGTRLSEALTSLLKLSEEVLSKAKLGEEYKTPYFIMISDGEDFSKTTFRLGDFEKYRGQFIFLGVGKDKAMPVPVWREGQKSYLYDKQGQMVMSKPNFDSLKQLAGITAGVFAPFEGTALQKILGQLSGGMGRGGGVIQVKFSQPQYGVLGIFLLLLIFVKILWRRCASVWMWGILCGFVTVSSSYAQSPWTYWRHEKAKEAFRKQDMDGARQNLQKNLGDEDVHRIEEYNLGVLEAETGNLETAQKHFSNVESGITPLDQLPSAERRSKMSSTFNQGVMAYRQGKDTEALQYFKKSLDDAYSLKTTEEPWLESFKENTQRHISKILREKKMESESSQGEKQDKQPSSADQSAQDMSKAEELKKRLMKQKLKQDGDSTDASPIMAMPSEEKSDDPDSGPEY